MAQEQKPRSFVHALTAKLAASRFLTTSLVIHIALISLLGGVVLFKAAQQQEAFVAVAGADGILTGEETEAASDADEPVEFDQPASDPAQPTATNVSPASAISALADASSATWSISAPSDQQLMGTSFGTDLKPTVSGASVGGSRTGKTGSGKLSGSLFGVKIETKKLGVMVDVSGSAHPYLLGALEEVDKSFKGMPTVLVFGCGALEKNKSSSFSMKSASKSDRDYEKQVGVAESVYGQVANARKNPKLKELDKYLERLLRRSDVYWSVNDKDVNPRFGAHIVMDFLAGQGVDTIYWFADFEDKFEEEAAQDIARKLKAKGVRVIAQNFGNNAKAPGLKSAEIIVQNTGGQWIKKK